MDRDPIAGDEEDARSVVSSIHGMPGDESMCVLMTQSPTYPIARQEVTIAYYYTTVYHF